MKKILRSTALLFAMAVSTTGFAQDGTSTSSSTDTRENFKFGVKAGINLSNVYDEENEELVADGKVGFAGGVFFSIPLGKFVGIQPEVLYSEKGFKSEGSFLGADYEFKRKTSHIDIPVHFQIKPVENLSILVGPQFSYLLNTETELNGFSGGSEEEINGDNYKKGVFGLSAGIDFNVENFVISGRAAWDLSKTDKDGDESTLRYKNQVIQFTVGYTFM